MKFIHLADLHLGKTVKDFSMIEDQKFMLEKIVETAEKEKIDAVLIAGDVYDRTIPPEDAVKLFDNFIFALSEINVKVLLISGNHDSDERLNFGSRLFVDKGIFFSTKYEGILYKKTFNDEYGPINFYLLPFVKASQVKHYFPDEEIESYEDAVRTVISSAEINKEERNVIIAHQFVAGRGGEITLGGSENPAVMNVGLVEQIGFSVFDDFDYAALGHIHKAQKIGRDEVRYAGAILKYHVDEVNDEKSFPIVTIKEKGKVDISLKSIKALRDMRALRGNLKQLLSEENITDTDDYIFVTLTDEDIVDDAMNIFRNIYPNTMQIRYDNSYTKEIEKVDFSKIKEERSFTELISDFYMQIYQTEITDEEMAVMKKAAGKAGIINETD
ncbi:exonuclease SbcCD subunit D [Lachnospiraceae bacterium C1.1]|nr:exonuclease SbcCD subunit D [Lachnospiraceae bacterium C1.1]